MMNWIEENMTNYVESVKFGMDDFKKIQAKASKFGLPMAVFFTTKPKTTAVLKWLSTEYRRRALVVQVASPIAKNQPVLEEFGIKADSGASLIIVSPTGDRITYSDGDFSRRKLDQFLREHAVKEPVYEPIEKSSENNDNNASFSNDENIASKESAGIDASQQQESTLKVHTEL